MKRDTNLKTKDLLCTTVLPAPCASLAGFE
jgi:hypothetical protein